MSILRCFLIFLAMVALASLAGQLNPEPQIAFVIQGLAFAGIYYVVKWTCPDRALAIVICSIEVIATVFTALASTYVYIDNAYLAAVYLNYDGMMYTLLGLQLLAFATIRTRYKDAIIRRVPFVASDSLPFLSRHCDDRCVGQVHNSKGER